MSFSFLLLHFAMFTMLSHFSRPSVNAALHSSHRDSDSSVMIRRHYKEAKISNDRDSRVILSLIRTRIVPSRPKERNAFKEPLRRSDSHICRCFGYCEGSKRILCSQQPETAPVVSRRSRRFRAVPGMRASLVQVVLPATPTQ